VARDGWYGRGFWIPRERLLLACAAIGIETPVELKLTTYRSDRGTVGRLVGLRNGVWRIAVETYLSPRQGSLTVFHELAHVLQAERVGSFEALLELQDKEFRGARVTGRGQRTYLRSWAISRTPLEQEAERLAKRWHRGLPLAER
jgi:hypothetical protein